jgi:hypothetical protein
MTRAPERRLRVLPIVMKVVHLARSTGRHVCNGSFDVQVERKIYEKIYYVSHVTGCNNPATLTQGCGRHADQDRREKVKNMNGRMIPFGYKQKSTP